MKLSLKKLSIITILIFILGAIAACGKSSDSDRNDDPIGNNGDASTNGLVGSNETSGSLDVIKERGYIKIGVFSDKHPFGYVDENGVSQGFDVHIARRFAKDLLGDESKVEFVLVDAASRVAFLESNKVDIIMANFTVTEERSEKVDFTLPYMKVSLGSVSPEGSPITSIDDLKDKKVIVAKGTTAETFLTKNYPEIKQLKFEQYTEIFEALKDGRGAAIINDNTEVIAWAEQNPGFSVGIPNLGDDSFIAPAVKKGNQELLNWINNEIVALGEENFIHEAYDATLLEIYGEEFKEELVIEGGKAD